MVLSNIKKNTIYIAVVIVLVVISLIAASLAKELHVTRVRLVEDLRIIESLKSDKETLLEHAEELSRQLIELQEKLIEIEDKQNSNDEDIQSLKDKVSFLPENMKIDRKINTVVTAYTVDTCGKKPGDRAYGITATGTKATVGRTVAVDPRLIPLGSYIYIPQFASYPNKGIFKAEDTGVPGLFGVDVLVQDLSTAYKIGRSIKEVYVLK